jgi:hypothetical protein
VVWRFPWWAKAGLVRKRIAPPEGFGFVLVRWVL